MEIVYFWMHLLWHYKKQISVFVLIIVAIGSGYHWRYSGSSIDRESRHIGQMYQDLQESSFGSAGKYVTDAEVLRKHQDSGRVQAYFSREEIPAKYLSLIPESAQPILKENQYRILLIGEDHVWSVEPGRKPSRVDNP